MATNVRVNSYMKNLAKSAGYIGFDVLKSYAPVMTSLAKSSKEATQSTYQAIKDFTSSSSSSDFSFDGIKEKTGQSISNVWKNTIDDLKTGKIYNKERKDALDNELMEGFFGDDFNFDFDDFDDWGDDDFSSDTTEETKATIAAQAQGTKAVINAVDAMGRGLSASMTEAQIESANYIASSAREDSRALFDLNKAGYASINKALMSVNETIYNFSKIGEPLTAHMQNSSLFFTKTGESLNNIEQTLKQIEKNTTPVSAVGSKGYKSKRSLGSIMSDDNGIDFGELRDAMKETIDEYKDMISMFTGMTKGSTKNNLKNVSLAGMGGTWLVKQLIPKAVEESIKGLDESIKYGMGAGLTKLRKKGIKGGGAAGELVNLLLGELVPDRNVKNTINSGNYEKGPVAWDGIARKALTDVIPTTLLEIYSVLSGQPSMRFDYNSGKFVEARGIRNNLAQTKRRYVEEAGGGLYEEIIKEIKNSSGNNKKKQEKMMQEAYKYFEKAFDTGEHDIRSNSLGIDPATYAIIKMVADSRLSRGGAAARSINRWVVESNRSAADFTNHMMSEEASGMSSLQSLHDELKGEGKDSGHKGTNRTIIGLDEYGHNYYFYLQGIWQFTNYMAKNIGSFGNGKGGEVDADDLNVKYPDIPTARSQGEKTTTQSNAGLGLYSDEETEHAKHVEDTKTKLGKWFKENVSNRTRKIVNEIFGTNLTPEQFTMVGIMDSISNSIDRLLFGNENDAEDGLFGHMIKKTNELFGNANDWFQRKIVDKLKEKAGNLKDSFLASGWVEDTKRVLGNVKDSTLGTARKIFIGEDNGMAAYGRKITKSGIVTVSEGELIIPSEYNPFYHGATNKASQRRNEMRLSRGRYPMFIEGGQISLGDFGSGGGLDIDPFAVIAEEKKANKAKNKKPIKIAPNSFVGLLLAGVTNAFSGIKNAVDGMTSKEQIEQDKKNISAKISKALGEVGGAKGELGAGAILGVAGSILTGGIIGPIAGAALGAGIGFISKSKAAQDLIFGEEETVFDPETGKAEIRRKRQELFNFMYKNLPAMGKGAAIGGAAGLFMGSPVVGAFLGAGIGFASSSEKFKKWLLGDADNDNGVIPKELQDKVKKALPNIVLGATGGALLGPFGLVGNVLLGSALGFSATSGKLHDALFGKEGEDDKESILYITKEKIFGGLDNIFHNVNNRLKVFFTDLGKKIRNKISKKIDKLKLDAESGNASFGSRVLGKALKVGGKVADWTVRLPFRMAGGIVGKIDDSIQRGNLIKGYSTWNRSKKRNMTARERIASKKKYGYWTENDIFGNFDKFLLSIDGPDAGKRINYYKSLFEDIRTLPKTDPMYEERLNELVNDKEFKEYMGQGKQGKSGKALKKFVQTNATKLSQLTVDEANREGLSEAEQKEIRELKSLKLQETIAEYIQKIFEKGVKINREDEKTETPEGVVGPNADLLNPNKPNANLLAGTENPFWDGQPGTEKTEVDDLGNEYTLIKQSDGTWKKAKDKETKESEGKIKTFFDSILVIPNLIKGIGNNVKTALFGDGKEKDGIFGKAKKFLNKMFSKILKPILGVAAVAFGLFLLFKGLFGKQNSWSNKILNWVGSKVGFGAASGNGELINGMPDDNGGTKTQFQDINGNMVTAQFDENGNKYYVDENGNVVDNKDVMRVKAGKDTMLTKFRNTTLRQAILRKPTLAGAIGKKIIKSNKITKGIYEYAENNSGKILAKIGQWFDVLIQKFPSIVEKMPIDDVTKTKLIQKFPNCLDDLLKSLENNAFARTIKGVWNDFSDMVPVLNVIVAVSDFITGWEDARTTLGITDEPSKGQRLISGLLRLVKNLIPYVGPFIPDDLIVTVFVKVLGPYIKDMGKLVEQRDKAKKEVEAYNEAHGTNYTVAEYNKAVLNDYTFTERFKNAFDTGIQQFKDNKSAAKNAYEQAGGGISGATAAFKEWSGVNVALDAYKQSGGGAKGIWEAIVAKAEHDPFGEGTGKVLKLVEYAFKGDKKFWDPQYSMLNAFKDSQAENGVKSSAFSKIIGSIQFIPFKMALVPVASVTTLGRMMYDKVKEHLSPIQDDYNGFKSYIYAMLKNDEEGKYESTKATNYEPTSKLAPVFKFGAKVVKIISVVKNMVNKLIGYVSTITFGLIGGEDSTISKLMNGNVSGAAKDVTENVASKTTTGQLITNGINILKTGFSAIKNSITKNSSSSSSESGSGSGLAVSGSGISTGGFQSQLDPRYRKISFGGSNIGQAGCGPAVATMASRTMGGNLDMSEAIKKARAYTDSRGTSAKYFKDTLNASTLSNTNTVKSALESGRPVILLGRDPSNKSKADSPFGPNNHYVLATAMKNGKVLVNDPESSGPRMYDQSILSKSNYNLTYGGYSGMGTTGVGKTSVSDTIWNTLKSNGFSDAAASGILGNAQQESSMSPTADAAAYGLFQFEKSTGAASGLESYASSQGKSKDDVETQTNYMLSLFKDQVSTYSGNGTYTYANGTETWWPTKVTIDDFKGLSDPEEAAEIFERTYERPSVPMREQRKAYAADFYELYNGTGYTKSSDSSDSSSDSSSSDSSSSSSSSSDSSSSEDTGLLAQLSRIFGSLTNIFNTKDGFSINDSSGSSSGSGDGGGSSASFGSSSGGVTNASGAAAAATAASNEIGYAETGNNITKFGAWSGCDGQPWCAAFAAWAIAQAFDGTKDKAVQALYNCSNVNYTPTLTDTFKANNAWYEEPEVGDEVMYGNPGAYHVGLVTSVDKSAKTFESVEGNTSDKVTKKSHSSYMDGNVIGFGRPNYDGASAQIASNGNGDSEATMSGDDTSFKATGSGLRGGSSGLLRRVAPSRFTYGSLKGKSLFGKGSGLVSKNRFRGAGSGMTAAVTKTLTSIKSDLTKSGGRVSGIDPSLVADLLASITGLLDSIAANTAPTEKIYNVLSEYVDYVKGNSNQTGSTRDSNQKVNMPTNTNDIDSNLVGLVQTLTAIARG